MGYQGYTIYSSGSMVYTSGSVNAIGFSNYQEPKIVPDRKRCHYCGALEKIDQKDKSICQGCGSEYREEKHYSRSRPRISYIDTDDEYVTTEIAANQDRKSKGLMSLLFGK